MTPSLEERISFVKSKLLSSHMVKVKTNWLTECCGYLVENGISDNQLLFEEVYDQFLVSDVIDSSNPVIPAFVLQKKELLTLNGTFVLQMNHLVDICEFFSCFDY